MRSLQGHCGVPEVSPLFFTLLEIPHDWKLTYLSYRILEQWQVNRTRRTDRRRHQWSQRKTSMHRREDAPIGWSWCNQYIFTWRSRKTEDRNLSTRQLCDYSAEHHADRSKGDSGEIPPKRFGDKFWSMRDHRKSQQLHARVVLLEQKKTQCSHILHQQWETRCDHLWNQHKETRCVITVNKLKALISTSDVKENQNSRQTTRTRKRLHWWSFWWNAFMRLQTKMQWYRNYSQRTTTRSTKIFLETSKILLKNSAISKVMKCSWSQTQRDAICVTIMQHLDTCCTCGQANPGASDEVKEQVFKNEMNCAHLFLELVKPRVKTVGRSDGTQLCLKARDHLKGATKKGKLSILDRYLEDERYRVHFQSEDVTEEEVKKMGPFGERPKRDHVNVNFGEAHTTWSKQQQAEQTVWPPPSIPICQKQKNGIESIFVDEDAILPHNQRLPAASGKIGVVGNIGRIQVRHQKDCKGRKENMFFSKSSDRKTRTLTLTYLKQRRSCGSVCVIWTSTPRSEVGGVDNHLTARTFVSAFTHCALARIPVCAPQHSHLSSDMWTLCSRLVISDRKVIGHSCLIAPLKMTWCAFRSVQRYKTLLHLALLRFAHRGHTLFSWSKKMYYDVVQQIAHRVVRQDTSAQVHHPDAGGQSGHLARPARSTFFPSTDSSGSEKFLGSFFDSLCKLVQLPTPVPKALNLSEAKVAIDKEWDTLKNTLPAWQEYKLRNQKEVLEEAHKEGKPVHFATLMDLCHLKNSDVDKKRQKCKGVVVLRGDAVKDGSGSYAVFTEQGCSVMHMTAAKVLDVISQLPDCAGGASDAVSRYTHSGKNGRWSQIGKVTGSWIPVMWIRSPRSRSPKSWDNMTGTCGAIGKTLVRTYIIGIIVGTRTRRSSAGRMMGKNARMEMLICMKSSLFLSVYVYKMKMAGKIFFD